MVFKWSHAFNNPWATGNFITVKDDQPAAEIQSLLLRQSVPYLVVESKSGQPIAVLSTQALLEIYNHLRRSRFPGDLGPNLILLEHILAADPALDFYIVSAESVNFSLYFWMRDLPAHPVLLLKNGRVHSLVPPHAFHTWLESLRHTKPRYNVNPSAVKALL